MNPALDISRLPGPAQKILSAGAPAPMKLGAARGIVPGLKPSDLVAVVAALAESDDPKIAETAQNTLKNLPPPVLSGALAADLEPGVIDALARANPGRDDMLDKLVAMPRTTSETLSHLAFVGSEHLTEIIATNEARLLEEPTIIEKLYRNRNTRMSTADRLIELAFRNNVEVKGIPSFKELGEALQNELIPAADAEPSPNDLFFQEVAAMAEELASVVPDADRALLEDFDEEEAPPDDESAAGEPLTPMLSMLDKAKKAASEKKEKTGPLHARINEMSISEKIRMATIGNGSARALLLRDTNKLVASAAIRSPMIQEQDVERISKMRTVHQDVLRIISTKGDWTENHVVKYNLVANPRSPIAQASRFITHLRDDELKRLEKNRDVSAPMRALIKQQLQRKKRGSGK